MEDDLKRNVAGSKALVFVEGETDLLVFKTFKDKIRPNERIYFIEIEGFTNYKYYAESKITKKLKIPTYLIFDGDIRQTKKKRIINNLNRLSIPTNHIYTLRKNSIENYLLNPKALYRAYHKKGVSEEVIQEFLARTKNKNNKKQVLQSLFNQLKLGSYNKKAAEKIAAEIEVNEIDPEIVTLLKRIMKLANV
jgi:predicted ATP-dependent endonuclease of OLD family